jgi:hypothetical protein
MTLGSKQLTLTRVDQTVNRDRLSGKFIPGWQSVAGPGYSFFYDAVLTARLAVAEAELRAVMTGSALPCPRRSRPLRHLWRLISGGRGGDD